MSSNSKAAAVRSELWTRGYISVSQPPSLNSESQYSVVAIMSYAPLAEEISSSILFFSSLYAICSTVTRIPLI